MTDEFNTRSLEDHQSEQIIRALDYTEEEFRTSSALYEEGASQLRRRGIDPQLDLGGSYAFHRLFIKCRPIPIHGINYRDNFRVCLEIHTGNHQLLVEDIVSNMEKEVRKFWLPIIEADPAKRKPLYQHAIRLLAAQSTYRQLHASEPFDLGISLTEHSGCRAWVPKLESFAPQLLEVKFEDICTILPPAERELLKLILGRAVVGRDNSRLTEGEVITHTARMAGILVGKDAGLGKSTLFNSLIASLRKVGYIIETFGSIASRFNLAPIALSHLCYKDDMTPETLRTVLKSENTKIMVTNGSLRTEDKGVNALNTPCHTVILANTNSYDPRIAFDLDSGVIDRAKMLETYRESQLSKVQRSAMIADSPTLKPYQHLPWLANKLDVGIEALMLYMARIAADRFYEICSQGVSGSNVLEGEVRRLTARCKIQFRMDGTEILLATAYFCHILRFGRFDYGMIPPFPNFDQVPLGLWLGDVEVLMRSDYLRPVRELLKGQYIESGKPKGHAQQGFEILSARSLLVAYGSSNRVKDMGGFSDERQGSLQNSLKASLGEVRLLDGFGVSSDPVWAIQAWENVRILAPSILGWVRDIKAKIDRACQESPEDWRSTIDVLHSPNIKTSLGRYNPPSQQIEPEVVPEDNMDW